MRIRDMIKLQRKKLLLIGSIAALAVIFPAVMKLGTFSKYQKARVRADKMMESWQPTSQISLTNFQEVDLSIAMDDLIGRGTNIHWLNQRQIDSLKRQIENCLATYSQGDFNKFIEFRMPCGKGVNVMFDSAEMDKYVKFLPSREEFPQRLKKLQKIVKIPPEYIKEFQQYSLSSPMKIWKYAWIYGGLLSLDDPNVPVWVSLKPFCNDCWKGWSPEQSWVTVSKLPLFASQLCEDSGNSYGMWKKASDLRLSPPTDSTDSTPRIYAGVKLHIITDLKENPNEKYKVSTHPIFVVFALTTKPECWIPISLSSSYYRGTKYIF